MMDPSNPGNYQYHQQQDLLQLLAGSSLSAAVPNPSSFTTTEASSHVWNPCLLATDKFINGSNTGEEEKALTAHIKYSSSNNENCSSRSSINPFVANQGHVMRLEWPLHADNYYSKIKDDSLQDSFIKLITGADGCGATTAPEAMSVGCSGNRLGGSYYSLVHPTTTLDPISTSSSSGASAGFPSIAEFQSALESARVGAGESILVGEGGEDNREFEHHQPLPCRDQQPMTSAHVKMSSPACSGGGITQVKKRSAGDQPEVDSKSTRPPHKKPRQEPRSSPPFKVRKEKLGDRIAALQQLVAPFGKTDTASVLMEAIGYIKFLQDQVETLSVPYLRSSSNNQQGKSTGVLDEETKGKKLDLRSRGLCLVPLSCTSYVTNENVGIWPSNFTSGT